MGKYGNSEGFAKTFPEDFWPIRMLLLNWKAWMHLWYLYDHEMNYMQIALYHAMEFEINYSKLLINFKFTAT